MNESLPNKSLLFSIIVPIYKTEAFLQTLPYDADRELVKKTCETFTRLLLSLTPYKAKEFVERNCAKVTRKIMGDVNKKVINKYTKEEI